MVSTHPGEPVEFNLKQVASALGVHYMTVYRYVRQGQLQAARRGPGWVVTSESLELFRDRGSAPRTLEKDPPGWAQRLAPTLIAGDEPAAWSIIEAALRGGRSLEYCYTEILGAALSDLGARWESGELTVADQYIATGVAERLVSRLGASGRRPGRRILSDRFRRSR